MNKSLRLILGSSLCAKHQKLDEQPDFSVVAQAKSTKGAVQLCLKHQPHIVILDNNNDKASLKATRQIINALPDINVIIVSEQIDGGIVEAVEAGASGFLPQKIETAELSSIIRTISQNNTYFVL